MNLLLEWADAAVLVTGKHRECARFESYGVRLIQTGRDRFIVVYGKQVERNLDYATAAAKLGQALMHAMSCEGLIDN